MLDGGQDIDSVQVDTEVGLFLLGEQLENLPASGAALQAGIGKGLGEDNGDDLLTQQQLATLSVLDDVGDGCGGCAALPGLGALKIPDDGQNTLLPKRRQLRIGRWLDGLLDGVGPLGTPGPVASGFPHGDREEFR